MLEKLKAIEQRYVELDEAMAKPEVYSDVNAYAKLAKDQKELTPVVEAYRRYKKFEGDSEEAKSLLSDPEMKEMAQEELEQAKAGMEQTLEELKLLLLPKDPNDEKNVIVEIRGGTGGDEAALFAADLYRMYTMYADTKRWKTEIASINETEIGGIKEISFIIEGAGAYSRLKFESGVHRVQRVPDTESSGRIQTSAATVAVLPEMDEMDFEINQSDADRYLSLLWRSGQHVNKTRAPSAYPPAHRHRG